MPVLDAVDLYRFYHIEEEETLALRGVSLSIEEGEFVAIQGPSGSGKSTLLACLSGLDEPDGGYVALMGKRITRKPETERAAARARFIGIMLQSGNLFDHLSIEDNIGLQMHLSGGRIDRNRIDTLLSLVGLAHRQHARPAHISGGEAARAGLAVAIAAKPRLLIADEPTAEVDALTEHAILTLLEGFKREGGAVLVATHSDAVTAHADRVLKLRDGRIVENA